MDKMKSINGTVLQWARKMSNVPIEDVAKRVGKVDNETVLAWESGDDYPTYGQLEKLGKVYQKPIAIFFFPQAPQIETIETSCRTINEAVFETISPNVIRLMNEAKVMQLNLDELYAGSNPNSLNIMKLLAPRNVIKASKEIRQLFGVSVEQQKNLRKSDIGLELWREVFLAHGIYVFKEAFKDNSMSGFCLYDNEFPIIYLNNSMSFNRQIFTLFHELYHLIYHTSGINKVQDDYLDLISSDNRRVEVYCNRFAADFLVPNEDFLKEINRINSFSDKSIADLASTYCVSREVIMRKLLDNNKISQRKYDEKQLEFIIDAERIKGNDDNDSGGNYYNTKISYLGYGYLHLVFSNYRKNNIDIFNLSDYTNTKVENIPKLEKAWGWKVKR